VAPLCNTNFRQPGFGFLSDLGFRTSDFGLLAPHTPVAIFRWKPPPRSVKLRPQTTEREEHMPQAIMDPGEVRRFAEELKRFNTDLQNRMSLLQARFAALGDTWSDQEHTKFSEEFRDTMKVLKKFIESSNQHTPYLLRKAQRIEEYLDQH
jgi:hypothetical protein